MSGKHLCQLRYDEKANILRELQDVVHRLDALAVSPRDSQKGKYDPKNPPNFLKEKVPRFKRNFSLLPLITHTAVDEVRFTTNVDVITANGEDPHVIHALIPSNENPFKPAYSTSDALCNDFCTEAKDAELRRKGKRTSNEVRAAQPICLNQKSGDAPRDKHDRPYDCDHNRNYQGMMVCNPHGAEQSYLCNKHVYPKN